MRIYIKKLDKGLVIYKETLLQSLISDFVSMLVMAFLIGLDVLFSIYITHSFVIDTVVVAVIILYFIGITKSKEEIKTKDELIDLVNEIII